MYMFAQTYPDVYWAELDFSAYVFPTLSPVLMFAQLLEDLVSCTDISI